MIVVVESCTFRRTKKRSSEIAATSSGTTRVRNTAASNGTRIDRRARVTASAAAVPSTAEMAAAPNATRTERPTDAVITGSASASPNHLVEKPCHAPATTLPLNAYTTTTTIGRYSATYTSTL